ncbi:MAG: DsbA family protein, partial [Burkholderiaceae bacterium]
RGGQDAQDPQRLQILSDVLKPSLDPNTVAVKDLLKAHTELAISKGVFGVPTFEVDGKMFFGVDALPMLAAYLKSDAWFQGSSWQVSESLPKSSTRTLR